MSSDLKSIILDINECESAPCEHDGKCVDDVNGYSCQCKPGYSDVHCNIGTNQTYTLVDIYLLDIDMVNKCINCVSSLLRLLCRYQ